MAVNQTICLRNCSWDNDENTTLNNTHADFMAKFSNLQFSLIATFAGVLAFLTMFGNLLVMMSFGINKKLRILNNYFLISLSVADFSIGFVSMPLYTTYILLEYWPLGSLPCDLWLCMDYVMSNSSALHLLAICIDRYLSVKRPLTYRVSKTSKKVLCMIIWIWIVSVLLWLPGIFATPYLDGGRTVPETECYIQFLNTNTYLTITTHILAYWLPIFIMLCFYQRVYNVAIEHMKFKSKYTQNATKQRASHRSTSVESTISTISGSTASTLSKLNHKTDKHDKEGDKAARTLSAILLAFVITWTPYHVNVLVSCFCPQCIPDSVFNFGYWLCYINSTVNPVLYVLCNEQFRWTFIQILTCNRRNPGNRRTHNVAISRCSNI